MIKYKEYVVLKPDEILRERISKIIEDNNGSVFHEVALNEIIENTFNTQLFYLVDDLKNIKSFSPVHVTKNKFGLKRYHFKPLYDIPYAGFVGSQAVELNKISVGFFESFKYEGFPYKNTIDLNSINTSVGETAMVDLSLDEDEIFSTIIHSKRRNMIRKAMKSGISIKTFQTKEGLDHFWPMLEELHNRLGYEHLTFDYYNKIFENYANKKQAFILMAFRDKKAISGIFILGNKNYMHYYKGASLFGEKNEGQGELQQWEAIKLSKSIGIKYYDLCNLNKEGLPAIYKFKTGISNAIYQYPIFNNNKLGYRIANRITNLI